MYPHHSSNHTGRGQCRAENALKIAQNSPSVIISRELSFIPFAMTKHISISGQNIYIECHDKALYKLHTIVKNHGSSNYKGARIPVPSGLNIRAWQQILSHYIN